MVSASPSNLVGLGFTLQRNLHNIDHYVSSSSPKLFSGKGLLRNVPVPVML